ncbi:MAG: M28 family peptidase [Pirellulaceae bacterium]|nr:M28 family peptidase [Pirellulaceae bacterium]
MNKCTWLMIVCLVLPAMAEAQEIWRPTKDHATAVEQITDEALRAHIRFLADDLLEGRGPGSRGDELTQLYLATQFQSLGFKPVLADGQWSQSVPLVGVTSTPPESVEFRSGDKSLTLKHRDDSMFVAGHPKDVISIRDAELVFVGYGIQAPEYNWDDFKGVDLKGKILVMMNNDPENDPQLFAGRRRLYYGRWDYKYESAARQGAAGAIIIHTTASAGYPYQVIQTSWSGEEFELKDSQASRMDLRGWVTDEAAGRLAMLGGKSLDTLRAAAQSRDFQPVPLGVRMSIELTCKVREQKTANVLGLLPGSDPQLARETVIFMAHHDHLGVAERRDADGDNIYNGAIDNASGTAALLTIARAIAALPTPPRRSIMLAAVGAEEQGLLGSRYLADHPPIHPGYMSAVINIDGINHLGRTHDLNLIGNGKCNLDPIIESVAKWQSRVVTPDYFPDRGYYYRSDQFSLAKVGVPGIYLHGGINVIGKPDGWGKEQLDKWVDKTYHQPSDEYDPSWDLTGAIDDIRLLCHVGLVIASGQETPAWNKGDEFEAARLEAIKNRQ